MDCEALQSGTWRTRGHPGIYLDLFSLVCSECDQLARAQTTKVRIFIRNFVLDDDVTFDSAGVDTGDESYNDVEYDGGF